MAHDDAQQEIQNAWMQQITRNASAIEAVSLRLEDIDKRHSDRDDSIKDNLKILYEKFDNLAEKVAEKGQISWRMILMAAGFVVGCMSLLLSLVVVLGSMAFTPIRADIARNNKEIKQHLSSPHASPETRNLMIQNQLLLLNQTRQEMGLEPLEMPRFWPTK